MATRSFRKAAELNEVQKRELGGSQHAEDVILSMSDANDMSTALKEWHSTGSVSDLGSYSFPCQLRNNGAHRYLLSIERICKEGGMHRLLVSAPTAIHYAFPVVTPSGGVADTPRTVRDVLDHYFKLAMAQGAMQDFRDAALWHFDFLSMVHIIRLNPIATIRPHNLYQLFECFSNFDISFSASWFSIDIESRAGWAEIAEMPPWRRWRVYGALTPRQRAKCAKNGLTRPTSYAKIIHSLGD